MPEDGVGYFQECLDNCAARTDLFMCCKFRQSCIIWELCGRSKKDYRLERAASGERQG